MSGNGRENGGVNAAAADIDREVYRIASELGIEPSDPLMVLVREMKRENTKLGVQVEQWTQTNLQLLMLLTTKTEENRQLAQSYNRLTSILNGLDQQLQTLQQQINQLPKPSTPSSLAIPNGNSNRSLQNLEQMVIGLSSKINSLIAIANQPQPVPSIVRSDESRIWSWSVNAGLLLTVFLSGLGLWVGLTSFQQLQRWQIYTAQRAAWTLTKLERIERVLGIEK